MKKIMICMLALCIYFSFAAADTKDSNYEFNNNNMSGNSAGRVKNNGSGVYVYPQSGSMIKYTVQGALGTASSNTWTDRSFNVAINVGERASIYNTVKSHNESAARLHFTYINHSQSYTRGVWSPDCAGTYTVYGYGYYD